MAFINPQKYKKTILSVAWPWVHMSLMGGSEGAQKGFTEDIIEVMFLFVAKPKRLLCSDILTLWEVAQMERCGGLKLMVIYYFYCLNGAISKTGISRNASSNVFFKQHDYIIEFFDYATVLKPSLNFTATVSWHV